MAGTIIPASLVTGLNSDLPGQVIAQVTENVFDTVTGQHLLVPQGSRLIGRYDDRIEAGQSRALVVWSRLIRPDGTSVALDDLVATDGSGHAGLADRVDRHRGSLFGAAILSSILSIGTELGRDEDDAIVDAVRDGGQDTINQAGQKVVTQVLSRKPTIRVRPGWRLAVIVGQDLTLSPYSYGN
ncbi:MAG: TrbI/VirB10 family protein [Pseudomonadota bacterium]